MQISRRPNPTQKGPDDWFTGDVYMDQVADNSEPSRVQVLSVHFMPGARTAWHTHPFGQVLYVTEGVGRAQAEGGPVQEIRPGDSIYFAPGERHWHGAAPDRFMSHIAIHELDDDRSAVTWGEHVTDAEYTREPS